MFTLNVRYWQKVIIKKIPDSLFLWLEVLPINTQNMCTVLSLFNIDLLPPLPGEHCGAHRHGLDPAHLEGVRSLSQSLFPSCHCSMLICSHPSQVSIAELIATDLTRLTWKKVYDLSLSLSFPLSLARSLAC